MGSLMKIFKPSKKSNNKENMPAVSFAGGQLKANKSTLNESVYVGEPPQKIDLRLKSPYAVITQPKTTRGAMSLPGAPIGDRSFRSSTRKVKDDDPVLNRRSELVDDLKYRNMMARLEYDRSMTQIDDSDEEKEELKAKYRQKKSEVTILKSKIERMKKKWREENEMMNDAIDKLSDENHQLRKHNDRLRHKYVEAKRNIEVQKKTNCDLLKMLQDANDRIESLEKSRCDESFNNSSILMTTGSVKNTGFCNNTTMEQSSEGAGEALCFSEHYQNFQIQNNSNGMFMTSSMFSTQSTLPASNRQYPLPKQTTLEDDLDARDDVRIYRTPIETTDEEMSEEDDGTTAEQLELSSPFEVESARSSNENGQKRVIQRSHSDSDLIGGGKGGHEEHDTVSLETDIQQAPAIPIHQQQQPTGYYEQRQKYSRNNSWLKRNMVNPEDDAYTSDSSADERLSSEVLKKRDLNYEERLIERQLKKKGGLVKYNPPRTKIHDKHYKRFGKNERTALAEFEYLQDMSTDVSGLQSSPEMGQLMGQLQKQRL